MNKNCEFRKGDKCTALKELYCEKEPNKKCGFYRPKQNEMKKHIKIITEMMESLRFSTVDKKPILPTLKVARSAMKRLIPANPSLWCGDDNSLVYDMYDCPNCDNSYKLDHGKHEFCPKCGQALEWEDSE